jgi:hypothetical protein
VPLPEVTLEWHGITLPREKLMQGRWAAPGNEECVETESVQL